MAWRAKRAARAQAAKVRWWEAEKGEVHGAVQTTFETIDNAQATRREEYAIFQSMYEARHIASLDGLDWATARGSIDEEELKENIIRSVINAATAKISTNRPRPRFLTSGRFELKEKAIRRGLFIEGVYHQERVYQQAQQVFRDAGICGTSLFKCSPDVDRAKITIERVLVSDIGVDYTDGKYARPRSMFQHQTMSRSVAQARWPTKAKALDDATHIRKALDSKGNVDDPISVLEAWHLPSGPKASDGRHVISTTSGPLEDGGWTRERFPFAVWRWMFRSLGWHGMGLAEDILSQQHNLDEMNLKISQLLNLMTVRCGIKKGTKINKGQIDNAPFPFYDYTGDPPIWHADPGPPGEILMERERLAASAFHQSGVSMLTATSKQPKGVTAAVAIQELKDTESERFLDVGQNWDQLLAVDLPECVMDAADDLAVAVPKLEVRVPTGAATFETVRWGEFTSDSRDDYQITPWPASLLPREPGGRVEKINYLMGMFPQAAPLFATLIDHPDVDAAMKLLSAPVDAIVSDIKELEKGNFITPEPFLDLGTAKMLVLANYQSLKAQKAPENIREAHRNYLISLQTMIEQQQMAARAQVMAMAGPPGMPPRMPGPGGAPALAAVPGVGGGP